MIEENDYKINMQTGKICTKEKIVVICDRCGVTWGTSYGVYKRKKLKNDYCISCRNSLGICGVKGGHSKKTRKSWSKNGIIKVNFIQSKCSFCNKDIELRLEYKKINNFCSARCRVSFDFQKRYSHLYDSFKNKKDALSYLIGAILGDGNISKSNKKTSRIAIANNSKELKTISVLEHVCCELDIKYSILHRSTCNFKVISFTLPDDLLKEYSILYSGSKNISQPFPSDDIIKNINFIGGMINTDGYCARRESGGVYFQITNTVKSIIESCEICLKSNCYKYRIKSYVSKNKREKKRYDIYISGQYQVDRLRSEMNYYIKKERIIK